MAEAAPIAPTNSTSKVSTILHESGTVSFDVASASKDLGLMQKEAKRLGVDLPATNFTSECFEAATRNGWADQDIATIVSYCYEKLTLETGLATAEAAHSSACDG